MTMGSDRAAPTSGDFTVLRRIPTRWADNDHYGHVNNAVYYEYMDSVVNDWLMEVMGRDTRQMPAIGLVVSSRCEYRVPVEFPDSLDVGLATSKVGRSSITYQLALFRVSDGVLCAVGEFIHVYVDSSSRTSVPIPAAIRVAVEVLPHLRFFDD